MENNSSQLNGIVDSIIYSNKRNGYTVLCLDADGSLVTVVGTIPNIRIGDKLRVTGFFTQHPKYGEQYVAKNYELCRPNTTSAIFKYLSSRAIKGVGPLTAQRIVDAFREDTFDVIERDPMRLTQIKGITPEKATRIHKEIKEANGFRDLVVYLKQYDIEPEESIRIWNVYGAKSKEIIEENPFLLCENGIGISFSRADEIASSRDFNSIREPRTRAAIVYTINYNIHNGYTCLPINRLVEVCSPYIHEPKEYVLEILNKMIEDKSLFELVKNDGERYVFLPLYYKAETYIASRIKMMLRYPPTVIDNIEAHIEAVERWEGLKYAKLQKEAIRMALTKGILILTGGPGTGKTTTLNGIIRILKKNGEKVLLAAPTGRAAQRMTQVTECTAKTIHRLLEVEWTEGEKTVFKRNEQNNLKCDTLILDEVSMVDTLLLESLLKAVPLGCRLIFVGDNNQLPSVGAGNVLGDMIDSKVIPTVSLNVIFRQSLKSLIVANAHKINRGERPIIDIKDNDFFFLKCDNPRVILNTIVDLCIRRLPNSYGYTPFEEIQILSPSRIGELGSIEINKAMQKAVNPFNTERKQIVIKDKVLRVGDKIMQCKNNYNIAWISKDGDVGEGIFNGDIGILTGIDTKRKTAMVTFDSKAANYSYDDLQDVELAYCCTIHKSQGNEFDAVIIPMYYCPQQLMYRNLLYTGVTRAKRMLIMVGLPDAMMAMVDNYKKTERFTGLSDFLLQDGDG